MLAPTRELAIQVAEATHLRKHLPGLRVLPVYGGQPCTSSSGAEHGVHVVVGTPGGSRRLRRGSLVFTDLETVVLDEGDEMLRMGFIDDVESILGQIPGAHQTASSRPPCRARSGASPSGI